MGIYEVVWDKITDERTGATYERVEGTEEHPIYCNGTTLYFNQHNGDFKTLNGILNNYPVESRDRIEVPLHAVPVMIRYLNYENEQQRQQKFDRELERWGF